MKVCDSCQIKQAGSWDKIKFRLNKNLLKKDDVCLEGRTDSVCDDIEAYKYQQNVAE